MTKRALFQALDHLDPVLLLSPGRAEHHGFEYYRHCTLSLFVSLDTKTGRVHGKITAQKAKLVSEFLTHHPNVKVHSAHTYSSRLQQVEIWFARIEREVISRGVFSSVSDLASKLCRYIGAYSAHAKPFK